MEIEEKLSKSNEESELSMDKEEVLNVIEFNK